MSDEHSNDAVLRLLRLLGERLESYLEGDEIALETLGETLEQQGFTPEELHAAILVLRGMAGGALVSEHVSVEGAPGAHSHRVPSAEERRFVSPEAWGYLIDLRHRGSLDSSQFERVLDILTGCGVRPVGVDLAREVATRVALRFDPEGTGDSHHGDFDLAH